MGVFGDGGTGKSTLIEAVRVWFKRNSRGNELIVTGTTGSAAVKVNGSTVHSAVCIPIETSDRKRVGKLMPKKNCRMDRTSICNHRQGVYAGLQSDGRPSQAAYHSEIEARGRIWQH